MNEGVYLAEREKQIKMDKVPEGVDIFTGKLKEKDRPGSNWRYRQSIFPTKCSNSNSDNYFNHGYSISYTNINEICKAI